MSNPFPYLTAPKSIIFPVWDHVPHVLPLAGDVDARQSSDLIKTAEIAWTRVHAIIHQAHASFFTLSDRDRRANREPRGGPRSARCSSRFDQGFIGQLAVNPPYDRGILDRMNHDRPLT